MAWQFRGWKMVKTGIIFAARIGVPGRRMLATGALMAAGLVLSACFGSFNEPVVGTGNSTLKAAGLSFADRMTADQTLASMLDNAPQGAQQGWRNNRNGASGAFRMNGSFQDSFGRVCRNYDEIVNVGGPQQSESATVCRDLRTSQWHRVFMPIAAQ